MNYPTHYKFIKIACLSLCLILLFSVFAFADDVEPEEDSSSSGSLPLAPDLDQQALYLVATDIVNSQVESGSIKAAAAARTIDDVYNILASSMLPRLVEIRNNLQTTSGSQSVADIAKLIKDVLYSGSSGPDSEGTVWALINKMYQAILSGNVSINGTSVPTVLGNLPLINSKLSGSSGTIYDISASSNVLLGSILTNMSSINTKTKDYTSAFSTNNSYLNTIRSYTASTNSFLKNFTFTSIPQTTRTYSLDNITYDSIDNISGSFNSDVYFTVDSTLNSNDSFIYHIKLPIVGGVLANVRYKPTVKVFTNNTYPQYDLKNTIYYIDSSNNGLDVYFVAPRFLYGGSSYFYIMIENSITTYFSSFKDITLEYISNANQNKEYYDFLNFMIQSNINDIDYDSNSMIADLHDIYASPEEVQARNASQQVINEALDDFTGNGSASAKKNDVSQAKDVSNALKSGLNSGGSSSDALSVFSPANAFWGWFSQDNANYFTIFTPSRGDLRSSVSQDGLIIDFEYQQSINDQEYFDTIGGYNAESNK